MQEWIIEELAELKLADKRLNKRAHKILTQLNHSAADSIPVACRGAAEIKAAYRFFDNEAVSAKAIDEAHYQATMKRLATQAVVLIPQDTTVLNFSGQRQRQDTGPTTQDATKGMHLHCALAVTPEKLCLGVLSTRQWHRKALQKVSRRERTRRNYALPISEKESYRWLENYRAANTLAAQLPQTLMVSIADREGDLYEIYQEAHDVFSKADHRAHYLIRAKTDRKICTAEGKATADKIKSRLRQANALGQLVIQVSETRKRKARTAHMSVYCQTLPIAVPDKWKKPDDYQPISVTAILCVEEHPPQAAEAIEWLLITDLPVTTFEEACEKINWYTCRWQIEIFFKILKSGCAIEKLQLQDENFRTCLSFYKMIAWRILYVVIIGRECPEVSCECVFSPEEWQTTYVVALRKKPPAKPPTLNEMIRLVASLGGYLNRQSDPDPGVKTLWIGFRNMQEHLRAKEAFESVYGATYG